MKARWFAVIARIAIAVFASGVVAFGQGVDADRWIDDLTQLRKELASHYANLDWAIQNRSLDLNLLSEQTEARLREARSGTEARRAIELFLDAFGDGHLTVQWAVAGGSQSSGAKTEASLCDRLNFKTVNSQSRLGFAELRNFETIVTPDSKYFPIGVLSVTGKGRIGLIRLPIFSQYAFPDLCPEVLAQLNLTDDSTCGEDCVDRVERRSADLLTAALVRQVNLLKGRRIANLIIDITGNGGGTNWVEPAARVLSAKRLRSPRQQFIRHPHWTQQLTSRLDVIQAAVPGETGPIRRLLEHAADTLRSAIRESQRPCTRDSVWQNSQANCSLVVDRPSLYPQSVLPWAKPGSLPDNASSQFLFFPSRYRYDEGVYSGHLTVMVDQGTWSSAEYFAAMLRDNAAATIVGAPTGGAGCGYTNGGIHTVLKNSQARVKVPDCIRLRADGSNEVAGITPDILIPWRASDNRFQRAKRVADTLFGHQNNSRR